MKLRNKISGIIFEGPEHLLIAHKEFEPYESDPKVYEEDKVVIEENHELPVEQRVARKATKKDEK